MIAQLILLLIWVHSLTLTFRSHGEMKSGCAGGFDQCSDTAVVAWGIVAGGLTGGLLLLLFVFLNNDDGAFSPTELFKLCLGGLALVLTVPALLYLSRRRREFARLRSS